MIAKLRRRHRATFVLLAVALPFGLAAALAGRTAAARTATLPPDPRGARAQDFGSGMVVTNARLLTTADGGSFRLAHQAGALLVEQRGEPAPDVLAYWTAANGKLDALPADAKLLGAVSGQPRRYQLPSTSGQVLFFSLAHGAVLAQTTVEDL